MSHFEAAFSFLRCANLVWFGIPLRQTQVLKIFKGFKIFFLQVTRQNGFFKSCQSKQEIFLKKSSFTIIVNGFYGRM